MKIELQDLLEKSFVITIHDDRFNIFCNNFLKCGLTTLPKKYTGFTMPNKIYKDIGLNKTSNTANCSFSHISIIKLAESLNWPFVCIFEDDAYPCVDIISKLQLLLTDIPNEVDMIKLGYLSIRNNLLYLSSNKRFYLNAITWGSHAYIVFKKYYQAYYKLFNIMPTADELLMNSYKYSYNIFSSVNSLFSQYNECTTYKQLHIHKMK